jgi:hypothetical protein
MSSIVLGVGLAIGGVSIGFGRASDALVSGSWKRSLERADSDLMRAFPDARTSALAAVRAENQDLVLRDVVVGDRITLVAPDGRTYVLRICDGASQHVQSDGLPPAVGCLNILPARHEVPTEAAAPNRAL